MRVKKIQFFFICSIYCSKHMKNIKSKKISSLLQIPLKNPPFLYLGCPIYVGRVKCSLFESLIDKIESKLEGWKAKILYMGGKITLITHVLQSIPIYILAAMQPPKKIISIIEKIMADFLWGPNEGTKKHHWIAWNELCKPEEEGVFGFRALNDFIDAFSIKLWWNFRSQKSL